jgi:hypothetical protein
MTDATASPGGPPRPAGPHPAPSAGPWPQPARPGQIAYAAPVLASLPPSRLQVALGRFWSAGAVPLPPAVLAVAAGTAVVGAVLVVGHDLGLGAAVTAALLWAAAVPELVRRRAWAAGPTALLSVLLVGVVAVRSAPWVLGLCVLAAVATGAVAAVQARSAPAVWLALPSWAAGVVRALPWSVRGARALGGGRAAQVVAVTRTVVVTVVLLVVFGLLFAGADAVFASLLPSLDLADLPAQVAVALLLVVAALTLAHLATAPPAWSRLALPAARPSRRWEWLAPVVALDALVLAFVVVQVVALVGGDDYVQRTAALTYAEYARQGFGQLVAATALTLVVVAVSARRAPRATAADRVLSRAALGVLCVLTLGVVVSALGRMDLYVDAYGLTRLRLVVVVAEVAMAVVLLLVLLAGIRWRAAWLPLAVVHVVGLSVLGLAVVNPDAQIVRYNVAAGGATAAEGLDVYYLQQLSPDAVPAVDELEGPLRTCLLASVAVTPPTGFADWNLGRARAAEAVDGAQPGREAGGDVGMCAEVYATP